jgi:DNA repair protein RadA/Sms
VVHGSLRLREAQKLGFKSVATGRLSNADRNSGLEVAEFTALAELVGRIAAKGKPREPERDEW